MSKRKLFLIIFFICLLLVVIGATWYYTSINGSTKKVEQVCAKEGERFSIVYKDEYPQECCAGLTEWYSGMDTRISIADICYETGMEAGSPIGTCINCGNNICEELENPCNCPEDCFGKNKSEYLSLVDFCEKDFNHYCDPNYSPSILELKLCKLC